jgi:hypothetical protein
MSWVGRLIRRTAPRQFGRQEALWALYVVVSTLSVAAFLAFNVLLVVHASS